ncbi:MAG: hypothetical protein HQL49_00705 [Gammaproteobacteria bacterium]|nr:hypothetical protein [Gammaproteobacteria bacterium]
MPHYRWMGKRKMSRESQVSRATKVVAALPVGVGLATKGAMLLKGGVLLTMASGVLTLVPGVAAVVGGLALHQSMQSHRQGQMVSH